MNIENVGDIRKSLSGFTSVDLAGPIDPELIVQAEQKLGFALPPQYKAFVAEFGSGGIGSEEFVGLGGPPHLDLVVLKEWLTKRNHPLPSCYYPLRADGYGNYDCMDISRPTEGGEFAIVEWRHDVDHRQSDRVLAGTYFDWFTHMVTLIARVDGMDDELADR